MALKTNETEERAMAALAGMWAEEGDHLRAYSPFRSRYRILLRSQKSGLRLP